MLSSSAKVASRRMSTRALVASISPTGSSFQSQRLNHRSAGALSPGKHLQAQSLAYSTLPKVWSNGPSSQINTGYKLDPTRAFSSETSDENDLDNTSRQVPHIRNVAIVAHVDHGKTTIVDELLKCAAESANVDGNDKQGSELVMDCGDLEKERGITITSKVTRLDYHQLDGQIKIINVVDT